MDFTFVVTVSLRRESGKFASRQEIADEIIDRLQEAANEDVDGVGADGDSTYVVDDCSVEEQS